MATINRTVVMYNIGIQTYKGANIPCNYTLVEEINKILKYVMSLSEINRKMDCVKEEKILFLNNFSKDNNTKIYNLSFISAKYNQVREVIDTDTLTSRGKLKTKKDGDREYTYISFAFEDENNAICVFECNYYGVGMSKIIKYFNDYAEKYYESIKQKPFYTIKYEIIPNDEFLESLSKMRRIKVARFIVDKENINTSDFKDLAGRKDIGKDVEISVKPADRGLSIMSSTIKDYYDKKNKNHVIKRILVSGESDLGPITLDTEKMKTRHNITVITDAIGDVESKSIFEEFKKILSQYDFNGDDNS